MTQPPNPYPYPPAAASLHCPQCGTELSPRLLSCPRCHRLVHSERLTHLATEAKAAEAAGDPSTALSRWREALDLLPPESKQYATVFAQVGQLSRHVDGLGLGTKPSARTRQQNAATFGKLAGIGGVLLFFLTKGKLLLYGLANFKTLFSMVPFLAVYWAAYGWKFALGLMLSIYVHEMGHVAMLIRYGMKASAPLFIPGLGAVIMLKQHPADPREDARIGLAGPMWGFGAAAIALVVSLVTKWPSWGATAHVGAWLNLFNMTPVWQLDGSRAFRALSPAQRWLVVGTVAVMFAVTREGMLLLVGGVALARTLMERRIEREEGDWGALYQFVFLVIILSLMSKMHVPGLV